MCERIGREEKDHATTCGEKDKREVVCEKTCRRREIMQQCEECKRRKPLEDAKRRREQKEPSFDGLTKESRYAVKHSYFNEIDHHQHKFYEHIESMEEGEPSTFKDIYLRSKIPCIILDNDFKENVDVKEIPST